MSFLTSTPNPTTAMKFYANVMDDVLAGVREAFLDEGVDEQVLQELKQMWEAKVQASKAVDPPEIVEPKPPSLLITQPSQSDTKNIQTKQTNGVSSASTQPTRTKSGVVPIAANAPVTVPAPLITSSTSSIQQSQVQPPAQPQLPIALPQPVTNNIQEKLVPIHLTLPAPPGSQDSQPRVYSIQVPASALASDQLQRILTAQVISATMALPVNVASTLLQQHVTASLQSQANNAIGHSSSNTISSAIQVNGVQGLSPAENSSNRQFPHVNQISGNITQVDGSCDLFDDEIDRLSSAAGILWKKITESSIETEGYEVLQFDNIRTSPNDERSTSQERTPCVNKVLSQLDGVFDTSDDDEDDDDDDDLDDDDDDEDDENDDKDEEDNDETENGVEEDPLNSGDDVSEGENTDLFETENVVVCQYDKINRSRNKWKFYLKDGIMNLAGRDYIFQKANGDAEW